MDRSAVRYHRQSDSALRWSHTIREVYLLAKEGTIDMSRAAQVLGIHDITWEALYREHEERRAA